MTDFDHKQLKELVVEMTELLSLVEQIHYKVETHKIILSEAQEKKLEDVRNTVTQVKNRINNYIIINLNDIGEN